MTLVTPVYLDNVTSPAFYVANRAHHADVGGAVPNSMIPLLDIQGQMRALTVDDEIRLAPQILSDAIRRNLRRHRTPDERYRDLRAGTRSKFDAAGIVSWARRIGADTVTQWSHRLLDYSERLMREAVSKLSDGVYDYVIIWMTMEAMQRIFHSRSDDGLGH